VAIQQELSTMASPGLHGTVGIGGPLSTSGGGAIFWYGHLAAVKIKAEHRSSKNIRLK